MKSLIVTLAAFNANLQLAHWQADTRTNDHRTLGDLYESLTGLLDRFAETEAGISNVRALPSAAASLNEMPVEDLIESGRAAAAALLSQANVAGADDLANIAADMLAEIHRAKYLLAL